MQYMLLSIFDDWAESLDVGIALIIALAVVTVAIAVAAIVFAILRLIIFWNYWIARKPIASGITGEKAALGMLELMGITDIEVKKEGFFRALFYNNHYNPKKKTIYLRRTTFKGTSITAVALAVQKAALVLQDRENSARFRSRWRMQQLAIFGPIFFFPIIIVGVILDFIASPGGQFSGTYTLVASGIAIAYFLVTTVLAGLTISVEKRGTNDAIDMLRKTNLFLPDELEKAERVLKTYILAYITDFILNLLKLIQAILKFVLRLLAAFEKNK